MPRNTSGFVTETLERDTWIRPAVEREGLTGDEAEAEARSLLATAALIRGTLAATPVPAAQEQHARDAAVAEMQRRLVEGNSRAPTHAPWYLRIEKAMRYVFNLGRKK